MIHGLNAQVPGERPGRIEGVQVLNPRARNPVGLIIDDSTKKKAGRQIEGVGHYRNGAGSARQEYRTLRGLNFV